MSLKIAIIGAGAWGTALAISASQHASKHQVQLWTRSPEAAHELQSERANARYLPGVSFPPELTCVSTPIPELAKWAQAHDLIVVGTPMSALRTMLSTLQDIEAPLAWLCKGFETGTTEHASGAMPHEVCQQVAPSLLAGALSGPSFALEVAKAQPTALVAASAHAL